jgi:enoyl-CoA hydratase/carnithine racemase
MNPDVSVIVITGKDDIFAVGADINELNNSDLKS